jgi:hypothetical protein
MLRFIVTRGVLMYGVSSALISLGIRWYVHSTINVREVLWAFVVFPLGGIAWGVMTWWCDQPVSRR